MFMPCLHSPLVSTSEPSASMRAVSSKNAGERVHEADLLGELVDRADAAARDRANAVRDLVAHRARRELGPASDRLPPAFRRLQSSRDLSRFTPQPGSSIFAFPSTGTSCSRETRALAASSRLRGLRVDRLALFKLRLDGDRAFDLETTSPDKHCLLEVKKSPFQSTRTSFSPKLPNWRQGCLA
jgi:hypothetical protein